ncbi:MAG: hypothetical protein IT195_11265 [Microthrixaceae bacterium]|nr:hypothetical protein [Microthrixaceae bacterium]
MAGDRERDGGDDPLDLVQLDDAFVRAATVIELSAAERVGLAGSPLSVGARSSTPPDASWRDRWIRRRERRLRWVALLALGALLGSAVWMVLSISFGQRARTDAWTDLHWVMPVPLDDQPVASSERNRQRLLDAVVPPKGSGGYEIDQLQLDGLTPVGFDPCRQLRWAVGGASTVPGAERLVAAAFEDLTAATGLLFVPEGSDDRAPDTARDPLQPEGWTDRWAPVLVSWSSAEEVAALKGPVAAVSVSNLVEVAGERRLTSGSVILDAEQLAAMPTRAARRRVVLHALGHLVGLDDVADSDQLMYPGATGSTELGSGDRRGLALLGDGACAGS